MSGASDNYGAPPTCHDPDATGGAALGIAAWPHFEDRDRVEALRRDLARLSISHLRLGISWADYHRPGGPEWFDWLIPYLARPRNGHVVELLPCVACTPPSLGVYPATAAPPRRPRDYADFLDLFATRYGQWFDAIELWNEPNNVLDWDWRVDPDWSLFSEMITDAAYWMQRRGKTTVLGGMCPVDLNWLRMLAGRGVLDNIDIVALHAFPGTWQANFAGWPAEVGVVREALDDLAWDGDVWITEAGYSTWRHDEANQAARLLEALQAPVERVYWYSLHDLAPGRPSQEGFHHDERHYHTGLITDAGRDKLAARIVADGGIAALSDFTTLLAPPRRRSHLRPVRSPVVVTGGAGFLGANLADALANAGRTVRVVDNFSRPGSEENAAWLAQRHGSRVELEAVDLRDGLALPSLLRGAEAVFHLAAQVAVTTSLEDPAADFDVNAGGTLNLLEAARQTCPDAPFLFASTNKVYGELARFAAPTRRPRAGVSETTPLDLLSPYGCSKGAADQYVHDYARSFGLRTVVLRMSCLYGPRQFGTEDQGWIAHFIRQAVTGRRITIFGDGHQVRDALFVDDAVAAWLATLDAIDRTAGRVFNLGGGPANALSLNDLLERIETLLDTPPQVAYDAPRSGDQQWYVSDTRALAAATGWAPTTSLDDGLAALTAWMSARFRPGRRASTSAPSTAPVAAPVSGVPS